MQVANNIQIKPTNSRCELPAIKWVSDCCRLSSISQRKNYLITTLHLHFKLFPVSQKGKLQRVLELFLRTLQLNRCFIPSLKEQV